MKINFNYKDKKFSIDAKVCSPLGKAIGLMFSRREKAEILLFDFKNSSKEAIHSYFVFFPFIAIWLDNDNKVIDLKVVKPFTIFVRPEKSFHKLIEIPFNKKYDKIVKSLVDN